ncbi:hypothetical protein LVD13_04990 [Flavobacteriaceae bacterium D16]|nr:hypothetical protein [Flavobacteriaceae bacterium D16]
MVLIPTSFLPALILISFVGLSAQAGDLSDDRSWSSYVRQQRLWFIALQGLGIFAILEMNKTRRMASALRRQTIAGTVRQHMKTTIHLFILSVLQILFCSAQTERIETELMDCVYQSYADGGAELKNLIRDYQSLLIKEGILSDDSASSYRRILQKISEKGKIEKEPSRFFNIEVRNINQPDSEKIQRCYLKKFEDSASFDFSKLRRFENIFNADNPNNSRVSSVAKQMLDVLTLEDFKLDYYKVRTFLIFSYIDTDAGLDTQTFENRIGDKDNIDLNKALIIEIDSNDLIYVDNKKVNEVEFKEKVRSYEEKNKSESIILLKADGKSKYGTYLKVQNAIIYEIQNLRENFSKNKYNKRLDELSIQQLSEISKIYPQNLVEK